MSVAHDGLDKRARRSRPVLEVAPRGDKPGRNGSGANGRADTVATSTPWLRRILVLSDVVATTLGWTIALGAPWALGSGPRTSPWRLALFVAALVSATLLFILVQRLYRARVCRFRTAELARLARACALASLVALPLARVVGGYVLPIIHALAGGLLTFVFLMLARGVYSAWLGASRVHGRFTQPIVLIGSNGEAESLERLLGDHPDLGFEVVGVVGRAADRSRWGSRWLGDVRHTDDAVAAVRDSGAGGVLIATSALQPDQLNRMTREFLSDGIHVQLSSGLTGIAPHRLRAMPLAQEPAFYLERISLARWQMVVKRAIDIVGAALLLVLTAPVMLVAMAAAKLEDRGPSLFRQQRVGRGGRLFEMHKLRTMMPDAEARIAELREGNQRIGGPLFKLDHDPRRTRVGWVLEALSLDELPQLVNVLVGEMSLVGPRPALPEEAASFDDELLDVRHSVRPGLTGLWQVEARDNPSFAPYRRLDVFYVENWSVTLDLVIMLATFQEIIGRIVRFITTRSGRREDE